MTNICVDCGTDAWPCTGRRGCRHIGKWEYYMVHNSVWKSAGMPVKKVGKHSGYLCIGCLETRLGRKLCGSDFTNTPVNDPTNPWKTPRLISRLIRLPTYRRPRTERERILGKFQASYD
jgi:hypothetical protein